MAQEQRRVLNSEGIPLPYATIHLIPEQRRLTANEDGFFPYSSKLFQEVDSVRISHIGYKTTVISLARLKRFPIVTLESAAVNLNEIEIRPLNQKDLAALIYEAFERRRNSDFSNRVSAALKVRTYRDGQVVELFEALGNLRLDQTGFPEKWTFTQADYHLLPGFNFYSLNTSALIASFSVFERNEASFWPLHPGRLGKRDLRKRFKIEPTFASANEENQYLVEYTLTAIEDDYLSAKVLINPDNLDIIRYEIFGDKLAKHPLESIFNSEDFELRNFKLITTYKPELNLLTWDYAINRGSELRTSVRLLSLSTAVEEVPLFFNESSYNDYEMAEILDAPKKGEKNIQRLYRSIKDESALKSLRSNNTKSALVFWDIDKPIPTSALKYDETLIDGAFEGLSNHDKLSDPLSLIQFNFNSAILLSEKALEGRTFVDTMNSVIGLKPSIETTLLVNLAFDEYKYAADRVALASSISDAKRLLKTERKEVSLRLSRLLSNRDFVSLLDRNFMNYQKHGVDRYYGLNREKCESQIFTELPKHLNPSDPLHLAVAYILSEKYDHALKLAAAKGTDTALWHYIEAVAHFFSKNCAAFELALQKAVKGGYPVSENAFGACR